jgi:hypothetical protein
MVLQNSNCVFFFVCVSKFFLSFHAYTGIFKICYFYLTEYYVLIFASKILEICSTVYSFITILDLTPHFPLKAMAWCFSGSRQIRCLRSNPSSRIMTLSSTQPLINLHGGKERSARRADNLTAICVPIV